jgi:hypothetical protein
MSAVWLRLAATVALTLAAAPALAYVRSTSETNGTPLYQPSRTVPFRINPGFNHAHATCSAQQSSGQIAAVEAVRRGFRAWTSAGAGNACTDLNLVEGALSSSTDVGYDRRTGASNENIVVFRDGWCSLNFDLPDNHPCWSIDLDANPELWGETCDNLFNCFDDASESDKNTLALTTTTYQPSTGRIVDADIEFNAWDGLDAGGEIISGNGLPQHGWVFTCFDATAQDARCTTYGQDTVVGSPSLSCAFVDLEGTATHEAGHFIGLSHPCELDARTCTDAMVPTTMYPSAQVRDTTKRSLEADDRAGLCDIYPKQDSGGGGCGTGGGSLGLVAVALGAAALLPRVRRRR